MSYELFQQGPAVYLPILLISLIITIVMYGTVPLVIAFARKKDITKKKYMWLCYGANVAVSIVMFIIGVLEEPSSGGAYLLWTWIFSSLGASILNDRGVLLRSQPVSSRPANYMVENGWKCSCGRVNAPYVSTCYCGTSKRDAQRKADNIAIFQEAVESVGNKVSQPQFCCKCGEKLLKDSRFCRKCGNKII